MSHASQSFITSPRGALRVWLGVFLIGLPLLFVLDWLLDPSAWEWHVFGISRLLTIILFSALLTASSLAGSYYVFFERVVSLDPENGCVTTVIMVWSMIIRRRAWQLREFQRIEVRHRQYGEGPPDIFQSDVGIRHPSGFALWLRGFQSSPEGPSSEALAFAQELSRRTGLPYDGRVA